MPEKLPDEAENQPPLITLRVPNTQFEYTFVLNKSFTFVPRNAEQVIRRLLIRGASLISERELDMPEFKSIWLIY